MSRPPSADRLDDMSSISASRRTPLSRSSVVWLVGVIVFALMIVLQIAVGVDVYPTVPPGLVISVVVVALVLAVRRFWTVVVAALWPTFLAIGAVLAGGSGPISTPQDAMAFVSAIVQFAALGIALVAGWMAVLQARR